MSRLSIPITTYRNDRWGDLCGAINYHTVEIIGEDFKLKDFKFSFSGGHRVRRFKVKKNVHFKIPAGIKLDITDVTPGQAPRRQRGR